MKDAELISELVSGYKNLPDYSLRYSTRARHLSLRYSVKSGLEVVVPAHKRVGEGEIFETLNRNLGWIERTRKKIDKLQREQEQEIPENYRRELPSRIILPGIDEDWNVSYINGKAESVYIYEAERGKLVIEGDLEDRELVREVIRKFLADRGKAHLPALLKILSKELGLPFNGVSIRGQKTRWGSCSSRKNINLNFKLLLLDPSLVRYVIIHELCHTRHMNHSRDFWKLVAEFDPDYREHERLLKDKARLIPWWC